MVIKWQNTSKYYSGILLSKLELPALSKAASFSSSQTPVFWGFHPTDS